MQSTFILLALFISTSHAGVGILSPQDEQNALQLFFRSCSQNGGSGGDFEGYTVWCKSARNEHEEVLTHQVHVPSGPGSSSGQVIFVSPPAVRYQHNILLNGSPGSQGQAAKIYVLPQKATHQIEATFRPGANSAGAKPQVFFLNKNFGSQNSQPQGPIYGPPTVGQDNQQYGPPLSIVPAPQQPAPQQQYGVVDVIPQQPTQEYGYPQQQQPSQSGYASGFA